VVEASERLCDAELRQSEEPGSEEAAKEGLQNRVRHRNRGGDRRVERGRCGRRLGLRGD
jgi:hypothetical protein